MMRGILVSQEYKVNPLSIILGKTDSKSNVFIDNRKVKVGFFYKYRLGKRHPIKKESRNAYKKFHGL